MANYNIPKPEIGDNRFSNYKLKKQIDIIRVLHYEMFSKDISVSGESSEEIRGLGYGYRIYIKGIEKFDIGFEIDSSQYLALTCDSNIFEKENNKMFIEFINAMFKNLVNNHFNFVFRFPRNRDTGNTSIGIDYVPFNYYGKDIDIFDINKAKMILHNRLYVLLTDWLKHRYIDLIYIDKDQFKKLGLPEDHIKILTNLIGQMEIYYAPSFRENDDYDPTTLKKVLKIN